MAQSSHMPWVIFHLMVDRYGVSANYVKEMVAMPTISAVPKLPRHFRGVMNLRGKVIPVIDLRIKLGMVPHQSEIDDLIAMLSQREQDHKNWIETLEASVRDREPFSLATDPHKCAFGMWYDTFTTRNHLLRSCLEKFDTPHKRIHAIAQRVKQFEEQHNFDAAFELINQTKKNELSEMTQLFDRTRNLLLDTAREIALVIESDHNAMAVAVDSVEAIEKLSDSTIENLPDITQYPENESIIGTARRDKKDDLVMLIDANLILNMSDQPALEAFAANSSA